jgi:hypothetical protein
MFDAMSKQVPRGQAHPWSTLMRPAITVAWASATTVTITPAGPGGVARIPMQNADGSLYYMGDLTAAVTLDMEVVGADGIDEGVIATATAYDIYLIAATGAVPGTMACLATVGGGAPTLPAGYTFVTAQPAWTAYSDPASAVLSAWAAPANGIQPNPISRPYGDSDVVMTANTASHLKRIVTGVGQTLYETGFSQCRFKILALPGANVTGLEIQLRDGAALNAQWWINTIGAGLGYQQTASAWITIKGPSTVQGIYRTGGASPAANAFVALALKQSAPNPGATDGSAHEFTLEAR